MQGRPPHGEQINCGACGKFMGYLPKPKNIVKRPSNRRHRSYWVEKMNGVLRCGWCSRAEGDGYPVAFHMDHIWSVEDGGPEAEHWNTMPLCADCHERKNNDRAFRLHAAGRSARDGTRDGGDVAA